MKARKLTSDQAALLQQLQDAPDGRIVVQINGTQIARTAYSLRRKGLCGVKFLNKAPGARHSYGYRGLELTRPIDALKVKEQPHVPPHQRLERAILSTLLTNLTAAGFKPAAVYIEDGLYIMPDRSGKLAELPRGKEPEQITYAMTPRQVEETLFEVYDTLSPTIHFTDQHATTWGLGVMVVVGNGEDFISDWHCGERAKAFNAIVEQVSDLAYNGGLTLTAAAK